MESKSSLLPHFSSDEEAKRVLEAEGRKLKYIAIKLWRRYLSSYQPSKYVRTRKSQRSIKLGKVKIHSANEWSIELTYVDDLAYHDSIFKGNPKGHAIMLVSKGWHSKKLEERLGGKKIERFTYFDGTGYLDKVYKEYMIVRDKRIELEVQWNGNSDYTKN